MWLADHLRGKNVLLLAGSNSEAAELSRRVQAKLIQLGTVQRPQAALSDGNQAGTGDLIRARLNTKINAGGRELTNRDTLKITGWHGPHAQVRRRELDGTWTSPFLVPRAYLADSAELDYAGNTHVGQGRTVDTAHLLVTGTLSRRSLYVGLTRGRESNTAHIVTGNTAPARPSALSAGLARIGGQGHHGPRRRGPVGHRADPPRPGTGPAEPATCSPCGPPRSGTRCTRRSTSSIKARLTESQAWRYEREHSRPVLQQRLRAAQLAGHDIGAVIGQITAAPLDGARSISSVLHGRLQQLRSARPRPRRDLGPADTEGRARGGARAGRRAGPAGPRARRTAGRQPRAVAGRAGSASWPRTPRRCCARTTPGGPRPPPPTGKPPGSPTPARPSHPNRTAATPNSTTCARTAIRALEIRDETEIVRRMTHGELEARILDGDRALASAPPDVSRELRLTAQAEADAWQQSADAEIRHDPAGSAGATALARHMAAQREQLEAANARYETWATGTSSRREAAGKARAELERRGLAQQTAEQRQPQTEGEPETMVEWWRQLEPTSPRRTGPSSASTRPRSPRASPGRPSAPHRPKPRTPRQLRPSGDCGATGTFRNRTQTWNLPPLNTRRRTHEHSHRSTSPAVGRPAWTLCRPARTGPCAPSPPTTLRGKPARNTRPALNAKPTPKPNRQPNTRPKPRTGSRSRSSYRSGQRRRDPAGRMLNTGQR